MKHKMAVYLKIAPMILFFSLGVQTQRILHVAKNICGAQVHLLLLTCIVDLIKFILCIIYYI